MLKNVFYINKGEEIESSKPGLFTNQGIERLFNR